MNDSPQSTKPNTEPVVFALNATREFGEHISARLGVALALHEEREFEDGEHKARSLVNVRGRDVFVVQSLHGGPDQTPNDKLCRLLFFVGALKDAAAGRVTCVVPYLCYARKDRKTKTRDPVATKYVAAVLEAVGADRVVTLDVHNLAAFHNAFRCGTENLEARKLFVEYFAPGAAEADLVVVSPDVGGVKRAEHFREAMEKRLERQIPTAFMEKKRSAGVVSGETVVGDVAGRIAIVIDDLISTGTTMARAARACRDLGAEKVYCAASHGLFVGDANDVVAEEAIAEVIVTNTIPPFRLGPDLVRKKVTILDVSPLFAEAINRMHGFGSVVELLEI